MIKKIICPIDFSAAARNGAEYAAHLAKVTGARLVYINIQKLSRVAEIAGMHEGFGVTIKEQTLNATEALAGMSVLTHRAFNIPVEYEADLSAKSLASALSGKSAGEGVMIVMGTNGADDLYQHFFGTSTYQVIRKANCPVLVVPEGVSYRDIREITWAWDYKYNTPFPTGVMEDLQKLFNPNFVFLHISKNRTGISQDVFRAMREEIKASLKQMDRIRFKQYFSEGVAAGIRNYTGESATDILALPLYKRSGLRTILPAAVVKELCETAGFPLLIIPA